MAELEVVWEIEEAAAIMAYKCLKCDFIISDELQQIRDDADWATSERCVNMRCTGTVVHIKYEADAPTKEKEITICYSCARGFDTDPTAQVIGEVIDVNGQPWWICQECSERAQHDQG